MAIAQVLKCCFFSSNLDHTQIVNYLLKIRLVLASLTNSKDSLRMMELNDISNQITL